MAAYITNLLKATGVSIRFLVSGWFCEVGGCGGLEGILPQKIVKIGVIYQNNRWQLPGKYLAEFSGCQLLMKPLEQACNLA